LVFLCVLLHTAFHTTFFGGIAVSCILSMWPSYRIRWLLINLTIFSSLIMSSNSSFRRIQWILLMRSKLYPDMFRQMVCHLQGVVGAL
jgi:hypothetical protein